MGSFAPASSTGSRIVGQDIQQHSPAEGLLNNRSPKGVSQERQGPEGMSRWEALKQSWQLSSFDDLTALSGRPSNPAQPCRVQPTSPQHQGWPVPGGPAPPRESYQGNRSETASPLGTPRSPWRPADSAMLVADKLALYQEQLAQLDACLPGRSNSKTKSPASQAALAGSNAGQHMSPAAAQLPCPVTQVTSSQVVQLSWSEQPSNTVAAPALSSWAYSLLQSAGIDAQALPLSSTVTNHSWQQLGASRHIASAPADHSSELTLEEEAEQVLARVSALRQAQPKCKQNPARPSQAALASGTGLGAAATAQRIIEGAQLQLLQLDFKQRQQELQQPCQGPGQKPPDPSMQGALPCDHRPMGALPGQEHSELQHVQAGLSQQGHCVQQQDSNRGCRPAPCAAVRRARLVRCLHGWRRAAHKMRASRQSAAQQWELYRLRTAFKAWAACSVSSRADAHGQAEAARRMQVAAQFDRLRLLHHFMHTWRDTAHASVKAAAAEKANQAEQLRQLQAEVHATRVASRFHAAYTCHKVLAGWQAVTAQAASSRMSDAQAARRKAAIAGLLTRLDNGAAALAVQQSGASSVPRLASNRSTAHLSQHLQPTRSSLAHAAVLASSRSTAQAPEGQAPPSVQHTQPLAAAVPQVARALGSKGLQAAAMLQASLAAHAAKARHQHLYARQQAAGTAFSVPLQPCSTPAGQHVTAAAQATCTLRQQVHAASRGNAAIVQYPAVNTRYLHSTAGTQVARADLPSSVSSMPAAHHTSQLRSVGLSRQQVQHPQTRPGQASGGPAVSSECADVQKQVPSPLTLGLPASSLGQPVVQRMHITQGVRDDVAQQEHTPDGLVMDQQQACTQLQPVSSTTGRGNDALATGDICNSTLQAVRQPSCSATGTAEGFGASDKDSGRVRAAATAASTALRGGMPATHTAPAADARGVARRAASGAARTHQSTAASEELLVGLKVDEERRRRSTQHVLGSLASDLLQQAMALAHLHYQRSLLTRCGLRPWLRLIAMQVMHSQRATLHLHAYQVQKAWQGWRRAVAARKWATCSRQAAGMAQLLSRRQVRYVQCCLRALSRWALASILGRDTRMTRCLNALRTAVSWSRLARRDAILHHRCKSLSRVLCHWQQAALQQAGDRLLAEVQLERSKGQQLQAARKRRVLRAWRCATEAAQEAAAAAARQARTWSRVQGWLAEMSHTNPKAGHSSTLAEGNVTGPPVYLNKQQSESWIDDSAPPMAECSHVTAISLPAGCAASGAGAAVSDMASGLTPSQPRHLGLSMTGDCPAGMMLPSGIQDVVQGSSMDGTMVPGCAVVALPGTELRVQAASEAVMGSLQALPAVSREQRLQAYLSYKLQGQSSDL